MSISLLRPILWCTTLPLLALACSSQRQGLDRDALLRGLEEPSQPVSSVPSLAEVQDLRIPERGIVPGTWRDAYASGVASQDDPVLASRLQLVMRGEIEASRALWRQTIHEQLPLAQRRELLLHQCLVEEAMRNYPAFIATCAAFLELAPASAEAAQVVLLLARTRSATTQIDQLFLEQGERWIETCARQRGEGESCAALAWIIRGVTFQGERGHRTLPQLQTLAHRRGLFTAARVEGPFEGEVSFAHQEEAVMKPLRPFPDRAQTSRQVAWDGRFGPSERGTRGVYRLTSWGSGAGTGTLFVTSRHALDVWVDEQRVVSRRPALREEPQVSWVRLKLEPGVHEIRLVAQSMSSADQISVSFLDDGGAAALRETTGDGGASGVARVLDAAPLGARAQDPLPMGEQGLALALQQLDHRLLDAHAARNGFGVPPASFRGALRALIRDFGFAPHVMVFAASALEDDPTVPDRMAHADAALLWRELDRVWADHPVSLIAKARALRAERPDDALSAYRTLVKTHPAYPFARRELARLLHEQGLLGEARAQAARLLEEERSEANIEVALPIFLRAGMVKAAAVLEKELADTFRSPVSESWARWLLAQGDTDAAIQELVRITSIAPGHPAADLLQSLLAMASPAQAWERIQEQLQRFPNDPRLRRQHVVLTRMLGKTQAGETALQHALQKFGSDGDLLQLADELGWDTGWRARLVAGDEVIAQQQQAAETAFAGHPVVFWMDHSERHLMSDRSSVQLRHWIAELRNEDALDRFGELRVAPQDRLLRLRVVKPDGRILEPEHPPGVEDVSLTGLGLGDVVEMLTVSYESPAATGGVAFETFRFQGRAPAISRSYWLSAPDTMWRDPQFRILQRGDLATVSVEEQGARKTWKFLARDVDDVVAEPHSVGAEEFSDLVGYALSTNPASLSLWRGASLWSKIREEAWLTDAAQLIAGHGTRQERWERLFHFVVEQIEPGAENHAAATVLATARGDRTALLLALAGAAGIPVVPVAVQAPLAVPFTTPTASAFSLLGIRAQTEAGASFAFVNEQLAVLDALPPFMRGGEVLELRAGAGAPVYTIPETAISGQPVGVQLDLALSETQMLHGVLALTIPAYLSEPIRRGLRQASSSQINALFEQGLGDSWPGLRVKRVVVPRLQAGGRPMTVSVELEVPLPASSQGMVRFERLFAQGATSTLGLFTPFVSYLRVADRQTPLLVVAAEEELEVVVRLPPGGAFVELPDRLDLQVGPFSLMQRATVGDEGALFWRRRLRADSERVPPDQWPALRVALTALTGQAEGQIGFVVGGFEKVSPNSEIPIPAAVDK